jgi:flagellar basal-body rod modification protein FlgD
MQIDKLPPVRPSAVTSPPASAPSAGADQSQSTLLSADDPNLFITLLTTQLQAQDPLNPMNAQDMVSQLTQVSSLQQLISINQYLKGIAGGLNAPASPSNSTTQTS